MQEIMWKKNDVMEGVDNTIQILNAINASGRIDYSDYCDLHDALCTIGGKPHSVKNTHIENFKQDVGLMEEALCRVSDCPEIWQNQIILAICKAVYHLLLWAIRREEQK